MKSLLIVRWFSLGFVCGMLASVAGAVAVAGVSVVVEQMR